MKNILFLAFIVIISCKPTQKFVVITEPISLKTANCPDTGNCQLELIPNKSIDFKEDEFGNSYPLILEGENVILKYTFQKQSVEKTQDSNYTEVVYAQLNKNISNINLSNESLKNVKLYFGRLCFCKGESGYYPIQNGTFKILKLDKHHLSIQLDFKIQKVPQIVSTIHETITLKTSAN